MHKQWQEMNARLRLLRDDDLFARRLGLVLARPRVLPAALLLDTRCVEHLPLELRCLVYWSWQVPRPVPTRPVSATEIGMGRGEDTYRAILLTSASPFQRALRPWRYSIAARSRAVTIPSLSDACAFQIRTLPSSEPESTKRESPEYNVEVTLSQY